jgi:hypothetical protein
VDDDGLGGLELDLRCSGRCAFSHTWGIDAVMVVEASHSNRSKRRSIFQVEREIDRSLYHHRMLIKGPDKPLDL